MMFNLDSLLILGAVLFTSVLLARAQEPPNPCPKSATEWDNIRDRAILFIQNGAPEDLSGVEVAFRGYEHCLQSLDVDSQGCLARVLKVKESAQYADPPRKRGFSEYIAKYKSQLDPPPELKDTKLITSIYRWDSKSEASVEKAVQVWNADRKKQGEPAVIFLKYKAKLPSLDAKATNERLLFYVPKSASRPFSQYVQFNPGGPGISVVATLKDEKGGPATVFKDNYMSPPGMSLRDAQRGFSSSTEPIQVHYPSEAGSSERCLNCHVGGGPLHLEDENLSPKMAKRRDVINANISNEWGALAKTEEFDWKEVLPLYGKFNASGKRCVQGSLSKTKGTSLEKEISERKIIGAAKCTGCHDGKVQPSFTGKFTARKDVGPHQSMISGAMPKDNNLSDEQRLILSDCMDVAYWGRKSYAAEKPDNDSEIYKYLASIPCLNEGTVTDQSLLRHLDKKDHID